MSWINKQTNKTHTDKFPFCYHTLLSSVICHADLLICVLCYSNPKSLGKKCVPFHACLLFASRTNLISSHLGFVHPLQDVALHQCLPSSSVCCLPNPGGSLLLCYVILPSSAWSSSRPLPSPWLPLCASPCPPIVL